MAPDRPTFDAYRDAGAELMELHIGYESIAPYPLDERWTAGANPDVDPKVLRVGDKKMRYPKVTDPETGAKFTDHTQLIFNPHLTLSGIPERAHDYKLGTRSGIDWLIDRYYIKTDKASGIVNDPNAWADEHDQPRYILDLIGRVVTLSLKTLDIIESLPPLLSDSARRQQPELIFEQRFFDQAGPWPVEVEAARQACFPEDHPLGDADGLIERDHLITARCRGELVGYALVYSYEGPDCALQELGVLPHWQGRGIGRLLIREAALAVEGIFTRMSAQPLRDDPDLVSWFEDAGFRTTDPNRSPDALIADLVSVELEAP